MALAQHSTSDNVIYPSDLSFEPEKPRLQQESFAGELALLRQQSNQLNQIIDFMPTGMVMLDGNGIVTRINAIATQLLDEPILGQPWFDVIKRSFDPREDDWHEVSLKDGRRVKLEITALGNQPGQLIMITDLTETRLMQDKLAQMQRLSSLGKMVSTLAHQIRTPLSAAMLYGANLKSDKLKPDARSNFQDKLMARLGDLEQQVNDMLLFAKSGSQQVVETIELSDLVTETISGIEPLISKENAQVAVTTNTEQNKVLGNKTALTGALQNLINNSIQMAKSEASIQVNVTSQEGFAYISVIDNGPGISPELAEHIFEPFYTSRTQGTGLGLAVVKSVATAHQGDVKVLPHSSGGAHFCIKLPLEETQKNEVNPHGESS
jgi:two-component system sensor histidine kinase FlrB